MAGDPPEVPVFLRKGYGNGESADPAINAHSLKKSHNEIWVVQLGLLGLLRSRQVLVYSNASSSLTTPPPPCRCRPTPRVDGEGASTAPSPSLRYSASRSFSDSTTRSGCCIIGSSTTAVGQYSVPKCPHFICRTPGVIKVS